MNETIMMLAHYLLFLLLCAGGLVLAHIPIKLMKYDRNERYLHCRPIAGLAFFMLLSGNRLALSYIFEVLDRLISKSFLTGFFNEMTPKRNYELVYMILLIILFNFFFILCADVVIGIIRGIFRRRDYISVRNSAVTEKLIHFPWLLADSVYMESEDGSSNVVNPRGCVWYHWVKAMKWAFVGIGALEILALSAVVIGGSEEISETARMLSWGWYMLPAAGYLLFEQLQFFLEHSVELAGNSFQSDNIDLELRGHLKELVDLYKAYFSDTKVLLRVYEPRRKNVVDSGIEYNGVTNAQQEACDKPHVLTIISNQLKETGVQTNSDYNNVLVELLNDSSVSVRDYLQGEILIYLCAYMHYYCAEGDTFLILCMDRERADELKENINSGLNKISKVSSVWNVGGLNEADNNETIHILVVGFQEMVSHKLLAKRKDFFKNLRTVVIDRAVTFSAYSNIHKEMIFSELSRISKEFHREYQYMLVSEVESPTLEASFGTFISKEIYPFKSVGNQLDAYVMVWAEEGSNRIQRRFGIGSDLSEYIGVSMTLSLVAVKLQFPSIHVYAGDNKPILTYKKAMNANMKEIRRYLARDVDYAQWIRVNDYSDILEKDNLDMIVLYDDHFNLYNTLWNWTKYGGKKETLVHIVSPPYLLRDYFAGNIEELIHRDNDFAPLIGWRSGLDHSRFQALLLQMANAGMLEKELMEKNLEYGWEYKGISDLLEAALNSVLNGKRRAYNIYESFSFKEEVVFNAAADNYETQVTIKLSDETIRNELVKQTSFVRLNHKTAKDIEEIPILQENITNYYLRDQVVSIKGILRNVLNIEDGVLYTENVPSDSHKTYYQASEFEIGSREPVDQCVDLDILDFNVYVVNNVKRIIKGYWSSDRGIDLGSSSGMILHRIYDRYGKNGRDYVAVKHNIQMLEIKIPRRVAGEKTESMILLMAFIMKELFKTLFPDSYMNLFVITQFNAPEDFWEKLFGDTSGASVEDKVHSLVPFIRTEGQSDEETQSLYIVEYSSVELGMISSLYLNRVKIFRIMHNYLKWYNSHYAAPETEEGKKSESGFLHMGLDSIPECLAAAELEAFCNRILPDLEDINDKVSPEISTIGTRCSFCGRPTVYWKDMNDGRHICRDCEDQMISQEDEIKQLYDTVVKNMHYHYGVKPPERLHLRFAGADAIRKKMGAGNGYERVLGFCERKDKGKKKDLWIEARGPRNTVQSTLIHELTHYWQMETFGLGKLEKLSPDKGTTAMEGHACYVEVGAMRDFGESDYADAMEAQLDVRDDAYGKGFRAFKEYMQTVEGEGSHMNPFAAFTRKIEGDKGDGRKE